MNIGRVTRKIKREKENLTCYLARKKWIAHHDSFTRFLVVTRSRSGSNLLMSLLDAHPNIYARGEEVNRLLNRNIKTVFDKYYFLQPKGIQAAGFKIFYYHPLDDNPERVWSYIMSIQNMKFIHLKRENLLHVIASREKAVMTGSWSSEKKARNGTSGKLLYIDPQDCEAQFLQTQEWEKTFKDRIVDKDCLEVTYNELIHQQADSLQRLQQYLEVPVFTQHLTSNLKKQRKKDLSKTIENYTELKTHFHGTQWEHFFN